MVTTKQKSRDNAQNIKKGETDPTTMVNYQLTKTSRNREEKKQ